MIPGLCESCRFLQRIPNRRGSLFLMCRMHFEDERYPKYPPLPVLRCEAYEPAGEREE